MFSKFRVIFFFNRMIEFVDYFYEYMLFLVVIKGGWYMVL